ncbi:hypothetical protein GCM10022267_25890 [Lentzea roselyniae]|uniref:Uncharacterized protein n=1 Tax=Lentzea roselyniae TaxID=531940 RepID=A0ABP7ARK0_9PSEU
MASNGTDPHEDFDVVEYADRVSLVVVPADSQLDLESETEWQVTSLGAVRLDSVWLERQIHEFVRDIPAEGRGCSGSHVPYYTKITRGSSDWGASGAVIDALLFIGVAGGGAAAAGVVGNAAYDLLKAFAGRIAERVRHQGFGNPISEEEASRVVEQFIYNRYSVSPHLLKARRVSSDLTAGTVDIEYVDDRGVIYSCQVYSPPEGTVAVTRVSRAAEDGSQLKIRRLTDS